jgi:hypothetical protein
MGTPVPVHSSLMGQLLFLNRNLSILEYILSPSPFEIDCDITANNIPSPAADDVSHIT